MPEFDGYRPGCLAGIVGLHARYYSQHWGFGLPFETKVASELAEFLQRFDAARDVLLTAWEGDTLIGSVVVDVSGGGPNGAHLRWFIVDDGVQGGGLGKQLLGRALAACDAQGCEVWLTTFAGLAAARALYERHGFVLASESDVDQWRGGVREQLFVRRMPAPATAGC